MTRDNEDGMSKLQSACLALSRLLAKESRDFILQVKVGHQFSFHVESGIRNPAQKSTNNENRKKKKKSPSGIERDRRRRVEFLKRKGIFLPSAASDQDSGRMEKLNTVSLGAQEVGGTTGGINDSDDTQNKKLPGALEEGQITIENAKEAGLEEIWTKVMKLKASTAENALQAQRLLGIDELKSEIDENLDRVNECLSEFRTDDSCKDQSAPQRRRHF